MKYLSVQNNKKKEISVLMRDNDEFWENRPLNSDMIDYATQDVIYLPLVYQKMERDFFKMKLIHSFYQLGQLYYTEMCVFEKIMRETVKCEKYAFINRHI